MSAGILLTDNAFNLSETFIFNYNLIE